MEAQVMQAEALDVSNSARWIGRILSGLVTAFMALDGVMKVLRPPFVVEATVKLGYPESTIVGMGIAVLVSTALYVIPRTAVLGAILLAGYLGGAVASHVRTGAGWFNILFPVVFATVIWFGLWLRDRRLQDLLPLVSAKSQRN
jgi:hypothetical protein